MKHFMTIFVILSFSFPTWAFDAGFGLSRPFDKTQNNSGSDESDPFSPVISIGHDWNLFGEEIFAPRLGYSQQSHANNDRYGGDYKVETFYLLYDFLHPLSMSRDFFLRYGLGTFQKKITGEGGSVTIPNGTGTATAYKPSTSTASTTLTANLGVDYKFGIQGMTVVDQGISGELFIFQPLDKDKRLFSLMMTYLCYF